jgi:hypothetical protein
MYDGQGVYPAHGMCMLAAKCQEHMHGAEVFAMHISYTFGRSHLKGMLQLRKLQHKFRSSVCEQHWLAQALFRLSLKMLVGGCSIQGWSTVQS